LASTLCKDRKTLVLRCLAVPFWGAHHGLRRGQQFETKTRRLAGRARPTTPTGNLATYKGWTYTYVSMNRLALASASGAAASFFYDGLNREMARRVTRTTARCSVWDGWNLYAEYAPGNVLSKRQAYGGRGDLM
jgi:hypothetical protein